MSKVHINPVLYFQSNRDRYILNSINNALFKVSPELDSWLRNDGVGLFDDSIALEALKKSFVISDDMNMGLNKIYDELIKENEFKPSSLCLLISQDCNLRCSYCYGDGGKYSNKGYMPYEVATKAVDLIVANARSLGKKPSISFFGGEPLLNFKLMKQIVAYAKDKDYDIDYSMTTNGTLINEEVESFITDNNILTQISIDGDEQFQDSNRYYANKKGSYKDVIKATENLRKQGLLGARATVTTVNPCYDAQILHLISLGFSKVNWGYAVETLTHAALSEMLESFQKLCDEFYKLVVQGDYKTARIFGNIIRYLQRLHSVSIRDRTCGAGHSLTAIDIDGRIYPCHRFVGCNEYILGTVFRDTGGINDHKFYNEYGINKHAKCLSCIARNFCCGGCMHINYSLTLNVADSSELVCHQTIEEMKMTAKLYTALNKEQLNALLSSQASHLQESAELV